MSIFDIESKRRQDLSVRGRDYIYTYDTSHGSALSGQAPPKDFTLTATDTSSWILPSEGMLDLSFVIEEKLEAASDNAWTTADFPQSIIPSDITQIFSHLSLSLGGVTVEELSHHAGIVKHVEHLIDMSHPYSETVGSMMMLYKGEFQDPEVAVLPIDQAAADIQDGDGLLKTRSLIKCYDVQRKKREVNLSIPLSLLFNTFKYYNKVMTGVPIEVRLQVRPDYEFFYNPTHTATPATSYEGRLRWLRNGIRLRVPKLQPSLTVLEKLNRLRMNDAVIDLNMYDSIVSTADFSNNDTDVSIELSSKGGTQIKHVLVFFKNHNRLKKDSDANPGLLDNVTIKSISVELNGTKFQTRDYVTSFPDIPAGNGDSNPRNYIEPYGELMKYSGNLSSAIDADYRGKCLIGYQDFAKYPVFYFDVSRGNDVVRPSSNSVRVNFTRNNTAAGLSDFRMYAVSYYPKTVRVGIQSGDVNVETGDF